MRIYQKLFYVVVLFANDKNYILCSILFEHNFWWDVD